MNRPSTTPLRGARTHLVHAPAVALAVAAMLAGAGGAAAQSPTPGFVEVEVATVGVELTTGAPLALLRSGWDEVLPIWIGEVEAQAIARALAGTEVPRPMTHDLMVGVITRLGGTLEEIRVTELRDETFLGMLRIRTATGVEEVDTRPSDALALAVRTGARVRVARALLANLPDLDFMSVEGGGSVARIRGITVGESEAPGVEVLHVAPRFAGRGLEAGDRIVSVEGNPVASPAALVRAVTGRPASQGLAVERERDGRTEEVRLPPRSGPPVVGE
jgi:uncharacterized protein